MPMTTTLGKLFWSDNENNDFTLSVNIFISFSQELVKINLACLFKLNMY